MGYTQAIVDRIEDLEAESRRLHRLASDRHLEAEEAYERACEVDRERERISKLLNQPETK